MMRRLHRTSEQPIAVSTSALAMDRVWAIEPSRFAALLGSLQSPGNMEIEAAKAARGGAEFERDGDVAVIGLEGVLTKRPSFYSLLGGVRTMPQIEEQITAAVRDKRVKGIMLYVDSPGGTVSGVSDLADAVAKAAAAKPVYAYISDLGASGAYYVASQATRIYGDADAEVGSIGVYMVVDDWSKHFEDRGVKTYVIKEGDFKGAGVFGTELTDEQRNDFQRVVSDLASLFVDAVARGRRWDRQRAQSLADGRVHVGRKAVEVGLMDGIKTWDEAMAELVSVTGGGQGSSFAEWLSDHGWSPGAVTGEHYAALHKKFRACH